MIVVDASLLSNALINEAELGDRARRALDSDSEWVAPSHLVVEVLSVLRREARRGNITPERVERTIASLPTLLFEQVDTSMLVERIWELRNNLTAYDAGYVAAAEHLACALLTSDARLAKAPGVRCEVVVV
jgi:predicted nucleic acid-binding protein